MMKYFSMRSPSGVAAHVKAFFSRIVRFNALVFIGMGALLLFFNNGEQGSSLFSSIRAKIADSGVAVGGATQSAIRCILSRNSDEHDAASEEYMAAYKMDMLYKENESLRRLLGFLSDHSSHISYVTTRVIRAHDGSLGVVFIPLGREHGVRSGQPVVDSEGLVGRVVDVSDRSARVLLVTDQGFRIPVVIVESGINAMLIGEGDKASLVGVPPDADVTVGELVITAGDDNGLTDGIHVGNVTESLHDVMSVSRLSKLDIVSVLQPK
ncbi:MAG: rod shape-determining protein MreC [Aaplasma endosymbiont of Hyalomma asiaticum]